ncbi:RTA1 like protein-domain-containing protein [Limtongia smithiae]|uniref:RTA1 like protein-domain-containing protein n=1 Tax=Limtongia smithiae TaxID=1125753 RepID=UPI0034CD762A
MSLSFATAYDCYGYMPRASANLAALVLFCIAWAAHTGLFIFFRQYWFGACMFITCGLETAGYVGRYLSTSVYNVLNDYLVQIICLTLGPAFFMAGIYYLLGQCVIIWGVQFSRFKPWTYSRIFIFGDLVSIVLQGAGGGMAATAVQNNQSTTSGTNIMIGGLAVQVVTTAVFAMVCLDYVLRLRRAQNAAMSASEPQYIPGAEQSDVQYDMMRGPAEYEHIRQSKKTYYFLFMIVLSVVFVYVRSVYRVVELAAGWSGYLMNEEGYFLVLDTLMVFLATWITWTCYPAFFIGNMKDDDSIDLVPQESPVEK